MIKLPKKSLAGLKTGLKNHNTMAKRQRVTPGAILEIHTHDKFYYAQILQSKGCAFFNLERIKPLEDYSILLNAPVLFIIAVYHDVITKGKWVKVGEMKIREGLKTEPYQFIQDTLNSDSFELYNPNTGEIIPATKEEAKGLECAAVWEAEHVESRLRDYYAGKPNVWVQQLAIK